jgi:glycosyltransferase involved in cell wall biosynthesis
MRIAIWIEQSASGGVDTHLTSLLTNWAVLTDEIVIFTNRDNPSVDKYRRTHTNVEIKLILVRRLRGNGYLRLICETIFLPLYIWWSSVKAKQLLDGNGDFDAFIADLGGYPASWPTLGALRAAFKLKIVKRILLVHHQAVPRRPLLNNVEYLVDRRVLVWSTSTIAVSNATRSSLVSRRDFDLEVNAIRVIHNGVDDNANVIKGKMRALLGLGTTMKVAAIMGRAEFYKGHEELIRAIALMRFDIRKDFLLLVIGTIDDGYRESLEHLSKKLGVSESVRIVGFIELDSAEIIADLDLLVCATQDFEGFGYTVLEAMIVGTPVVTTNVGAITEYCDERFAVVARPGSIQDLVDGIESTLSDLPETMIRVSAAIKQARKYSATNTAHEFHRELSL